MSNERYSFWFSQQHADHYSRINEFEYNEDYIVHKNFAEIDGQRIPYTCCTTVPDATEPFEGAMERFPDYRKVGDGTIRNIRIDGKW